jgi:hypothetical protein
MKTGISGKGIVCGFILAIPLWFFIFYLLQAVNKMFENLTKAFMF